MGSMSTTIETDLLERGPFLVELEQRLEESRVAGRLVLLGGEAGVGKTALLRRFCLLHRETARAFWGACDPLFTPPPPRAPPPHPPPDRGGGHGGGGAGGGGGGELGVVFLDVVSSTGGRRALWGPPRPPFPRPGRSGRSSTSPSGPGAR